VAQEQRGHWPVFRHDRDRNYPGRVRGHQGDAVYGAPRSVGPDGQMRIWLDHAVFDRLRALRRSGESYSDLILRLAEASNGE